MNVEFHYYMTYLIATKARFNPEEAQIIAYAAQYIDNNNEDYVVDTGKSTQFIGQMSQTLDLLKPREDRLEIYPVFHFIPGNPLADTAQRLDRKTHFLNTTPNSVNANNVFDMALQSRDLYRVGLACHGYVDTWAHQNFVGYKNIFNCVEAPGFFRNLTNWLTPNIGHADARTEPDQPALIWTDHRLVESRVDNRERFLEAAENLLEKFVIYNAPETPRDRLEIMKAELRSDLDEAIGQRDDDNRFRSQRMQRYKALAKRSEYGAQPLPDYHKVEWLEEALESQLRAGDEERMAGRPVSGTYDYFWKDKENYTNTNWYRFQSAVIQHQSETLAYLKKKIPKFGKYFKEPTHLSQNSSVA